jgi:hypothetical protein
MNSSGLLTCEGVFFAGGKHGTAVRGMDESVVQSESLKRFKVFFVVTKRGTTGWNAQRTWSDRERARL